MEIVPPESPEVRTKRKSPAFDGGASSTIFYGPNGLRAGWSILLYAAIVVALFFVTSPEIRWFAAHLHQSMMGVGEFHPTIAIVSEATRLLIVVVATACMAWLERRRVAFYGLAGADRLRQFVVGTISGFCFLSLLVGILVATHHLALDQVHMSKSQIFGYAAAWAFCFFLVGMMEEFLLRGYLLFTLARGIRFWPAAVLLAAVFGLMHKSNSGESPFGLAEAAAIALVFSLSLWRLGHLWWAIGFHMAWDWAESFFYGTADSGISSAGRMMHAHPMGNLLVSGGATGPEGSVWGLLVIALAALFVWWTQPYRGIHLAEGDVWAASKYREVNQ